MNEKAEAKMITAMPGAASAAARPARMPEPTAALSSCPPAGSELAIGTVAITAAAIAKLAPLIASGSLTPERTNSPAASSGPVVCPTQFAVSYIAAATWLDSPATIGSAERIAGLPSAFPVPASSAKPRIIGALLAKTRAAQAPAWTRFAVTIRLRFEWRSASAPSQAPSTIDGRKSVSSTAATAHEVWRWRTVSRISAT